jgi:hypothetical protein
MLVGRKSKTKETYLVSNSYGSISRRQTRRRDPQGSAASRKNEGAITMTTREPSIFYRQLHAIVDELARRLGVCGSKSSGMQRPSMRTATWTGSA